MRPKRIIISGGGTGGHIYPAIAIADEIKRRMPETEFLFVGSKDRMEMQKVPKLGYEIEGLWISGINRRKKLSNLSFPFKLISSLYDSHRIIKKFQPDVAIGTGGFASGPMLWVASRKKIPIFIQEQNSFPGITNKILAKRANKIFTAYANIPSFPKEKVQITGNPIRSALFKNLPEQKEAKKRFGLDPDLPVILSIGGSQGSNTINQAWLKALEEIKKKKVQLLWQVGKFGFETIRSNDIVRHKNIQIAEFIYDMQKAYAAADIIVSRAGAMAISELCLVGKPCVLLPFPFASEDHQTKNAEALRSKNAAIMISDEKAKESLWQTVNSLMNNQDLRKKMSENIIELSKPNATKEIVDQILNEIQ